MSLGGSNWDEAAVVRARLVDYQGRVFDEPEVVLGEPLLEKTPGYSLRQARMAGLDAPPGKYRLVLTASGERFPYPLTRTVQVVMVAPHSGTDTHSPADLGTDTHFPHPG